MKKLIIVCTGLTFCINANAGTLATQCSSLFPDAHCTTWDESDSNVSGKKCVCSTCPSNYPDSWVPNTTSGGYILIAGCQCSNCSCSNNPDTTKTSGTCTCGSSGADYSTCKAASSATLCQSVGGTGSGYCYNYNFVKYIGSQLYCRSYYDTSCTIASAATAKQYSKYCMGGYGDTSYLECLVVSCPTGATPNAKYTACVCKAGYYRPTDNSSCTPCPEGYYKDTVGDTAECTQCPTSGGLLATTASTGSTSITDCYIPAGTEWTSSDKTGSYTEKFTADCYYTE